MTTQNLFNQRPKTFIDYEPVKVPSKKEWGMQTKTELNVYDPFVSNIKIVGDDVTETAPSKEEQNIKYISPDGKREIIFDCDGNVVTADEDMGTYNYASPDLEIAHLIADILPWIVYGNTPGDTTEWYGRIGGALKNGK